MIILPEISELVSLEVVFKTSSVSKSHTLFAVLELYL